MIGMAVGLMGPDGETSIEHEDAALRPGGQKTTVTGGLDEGRVVVFKGDVHIPKGRRGSGGRPDGEGEAVGLVYVMVGVLTEDDDFDGVERGVAGPVGLGVRWFVQSEECPAYISE